MTRPSSERHPLGTTSAGRLSGLAGHRGEPTPLRFSDRSQAGGILAHRLDHLHGAKTVVIGVAWGGIPLAAIIASHLDAELDWVALRPNVGALRTKAPPSVDSIEGNCGFDEEQLLLAIVPHCSVKDRSVVVVTEGIDNHQAAGLHAACAKLRGQHPAQLVLAAPVGNPAAIRLLQRSSVDVLTLYSPVPFLQADAHYVHLEPVPPGEAVSMLLTARRCAGRLRAQARGM